MLYFTPQQPQKQCYKSHFSIFTIESGIEIESNKEKTIYTAREVRQIWKRSEGFKWESINRDIYQRLTYPFIARFIPRWEKRYLGREELENLQIYVRTFTDKGRVEATAKIFKHLGLVRAGDIVKNFEKIRGLGDEDINRWLAGLTDEMSQSILDGTIPLLW